jgi:hypothetical protein
MVFSHLEYFLEKVTHYCRFTNSGGAFLLSAQVGLTQTEKILLVNALGRFLIQDLRLLER